jgi:hypothetical protein
VGCGTVGAAEAVEKVWTGLSLSRTADVSAAVGFIDAEARCHAAKSGGMLAVPVMG